VVCRGPNCRERGGRELRKRLAELAGRGAPTSVVGYSCFGQCDDGPNVVFFPEGEWRGALRASDAESILAYACDGGTGLLPGAALTPSSEERTLHESNVADLVATLERDRAGRRSRWWWPF
jgi:(2Fe-2S) ferredoxin